jgi:hypothetical protein
MPCANAGRRPAAMASVMPAGAAANGRKAAVGGAHLHR